MVKRKASSASPYERPTKLIKQSTSSDLGNGLSLVRRAQTNSKPPLESPKFPPLKLTKKTITAVTSSGGEESAIVATSLRRASTLPIEDTELESENKGKSPSTSRSRSRESLPFKRIKTSDGPKTSQSQKYSFLLTTVEPLKTGSSVGETKLGGTKGEFTPQNSERRQSLAKAAFKGKMSRSASDTGPSLLPSLTQLASKGKPTLSMSRSALLGPIEEAEVTRALASLRSYTTASRKSSFAKSKSASLTKDHSSDNMSHEEPSSFEKSNPVEKPSEGKATETSPGSDSTETSLSQPKPHNGLMEIVFSFDTTGSMCSCLDEVRSRIMDMVQRLQADIPGIRIAIICHGDYCDSDKYIVQWIDFGASLPELSDFVSRVEMTHGGDSAECYELVLKRVREVLSWTPGSQRSLILIGDDEPHSVGYVYGRDEFINKIDWREEVQLLRDMGVRIYGVQVDRSAYATYFYREMAEVTGGRHLKLQEFSSVFNFLMAICYKEGSPDLLPTFEAEVRAENKKGIALDVEGLFLDLKYPRTSKKSSDPVVMESTKTATTPTAKRIKSPLRKKAAEKAKARKNTGPKPGKEKRRRPNPKATKVNVTTKSKMAKSKKGKKTKSRTRAEGTKRSKTKKKMIKVRKTALREKVSDLKFRSGPLQRLKWSSWHLGVAAKLPKEGTVWGEGKSAARKCAGKTSRRVPQYGPSKAWHTCKHYTGYRKVDLFKNDTRSKALYEIAVQLPKKTKKYVVYFRLCKGFPSSSLWDTYLIHDKAVQAEMKRVLKKGCNIHVRRGVIPGHSARSMDLFFKVKDHLGKNYDYAWRRQLYGKKLHRRVEKNGIIISHGNI